MLACTEVSISKRPDIIVVDTGNSVVDTDEPSSEPSEPSTEPMEGIGGYVHTTFDKWLVWPVWARQMRSLLSSMRGFYEKFMILTQDTSHLRDSAAKT